MAKPQVQPEPRSCGARPSARSGRGIAITRKTLPPRSTRSGPRGDSQDEDADERQTCARPTDSEAHPVDREVELEPLDPARSARVARLFKAVLCTVRRAMERETGQRASEAVRNACVLWCQDRADRDFIPASARAANAWLSPWAGRPPAVFARRPAAQVRTSGAGAGSPEPPG